MRMGYHLFSPLPWRERARVRGSDEDGEPPLLPSPPAGEGQGEGGWGVARSTFSATVSSGTHTVGLTARQSPHSRHHSTPLATWGVPARQSSLRHNAQAYPRPPFQPEEARAIKSPRDPTSSPLSPGGRGLTGERVRRIGTHLFSPLPRRERARVRGTGGGSFHLQRNRFKRNPYCRLDSAAISPLVAS